MTYAKTPPPQCDWRRALNEGLDRAMEDTRKGQEVGDVEVMWALMREACEVSRIAYSAPPRTGYPSKSAMPDAPDEVTAWQMISAYLRGEIEEMPVTEERPIQPSAAAISRAECVLWVWHHVALKHKGDWAKIKKAVYLKACGVPDRKVRAVTGINRERIKRARREAMQEMADFVYRVAK